jgi:hypothetical protein
MPVIVEGLDSHTLAYIAGIFDGEGSIVIGVRKPDGIKHQSPSHFLQVGITNTNRLLIEWLLATCGGHISDNSHAKSRAGQLPCWAWRVIGWDALQFLEKILPYLRIKTEQAIFAIQFQRKTQGRRTYLRVPPELIAERDWYKAEISKFALHYRAS